MGRHTGPADINGVERQRQAVILRKAGIEYDDIARRLGYSDRSGAWRAVSKALRAIPQPEAKALRTLIGSRYDALLACYMPKALRGNIGAAHLVLKVEEQRARLLGLNIEPADQQVQPELIVTEIPFGYLSGEQPSLNGAHPAPETPKEEYTTHG